MSNFGCLFYSSKCETCHGLVNTMRVEGILNAFTLLSVDNMPLEKLLQINIRVVPAIIVNMDKRQMVYEGKEAVMWVNNFILSRKQNMARNIDSQRRQILQEHVKLYGDSTMAYIPLEQGGISDDFAYLDVDRAMPKNFLQKDDIDKYRIITINNKDEHKLTHEDQKRLVTKYKTFRDTEKTKIDEVLDTQLKNKICENIMYNS
uniref:Thioredoxin domain-containing protein n=1 Tax=viral metagenome TaxID=1070528 RepID=A0A6C0EAR5_9ZZZZ